MYHWIYHCITTEDELFASMDQRNELSASGQETDLNSNSIMHSKYSTDQFNPLSADQFDNEPYQLGNDN